MLAAKEMVRWVKCLALKYKGCSSDTQHSGKCQEAVESNPRRLLKRLRQGREPLLSRLAKSASAGFPCENPLPCLGWGCSMSDLGVKFRVDLNYIFIFLTCPLGYYSFVVHHDEILEVSNFRKERFILAQHWRAFGPLWRSCDSGEGIPVGLWGS